MIKNEYNVTWEVFRSWAKENAFKGRQLLFSVVWVVFAVVIQILNGYHGGTILYHFLFFFALYFALLNWLSVAKKQYDEACRKYGKEWKRSIVFEDSRIVIWEGPTHMKYRYKEVYMFREKKNRIWLYCRDGSLIRMYTDTFTEGDWEQCKELLREKSGKKNPVEEKE